MCRVGGNDGEPGGECAEGEEPERGDAGQPDGQEMAEGTRVETPDVGGMGPPAAEFQARRQGEGR